jgi:hypothetical protein
MPDASGGDERLEAPAYLGRPFPGTSTGRLPLTSRGLTGLSLLGFVAFAAAAIYFSNGNMFAAIFFLIVALACVVGAILLVRSLVRRIVRTEGASGATHLYR